MRAHHSTRLLHRTPKTAEQVAEATKPETTASQESVIANQRAHSVPHSTGGIDSFTRQISNRQQAAKAFEGGKSAGQPR